MSGAGRVGGLGERGPGRWSRIAAAVLMLQVVLILGFSIMYLVELVLGAGDDRTRVIMSVVLFLVGAGLLALLALAWWRGRSWPRTPTIVWNLLLWPVGWSLLQSDRPWIGALLLLVTIVGVVAAVFAGSMGGAGRSAGSGGR